MSECQDFCLRLYTEPWADVNLVRPSTMLLEPLVLDVSPKALLTPTDSETGSRSHPVTTQRSLHSSPASVLSPSSTGPTDPWVIASAPG